MRGIDSVPSRIDHYIDLYLQLLVRQTPSCLKNTRDTIRILEGLDIWENYIMAIADVASLYTCIPHELEIEVVRHFLNREASLTKSQSSYVIELLVCHQT